MGSRVLQLADADPRFNLVAGIVDPGAPDVGQRIELSASTLTLSDETNQPLDVMIDFSIPAGTLAWLERCVRERWAMVIGPTGYSHEQQLRIVHAAKSIPIVQAANFSLGLNLLRMLASQVAVKLGREFDIEIIEHHHNRKIDAPSGSAMALLSDILDRTGRNAESDVVFGRHGQCGPRHKNQIGVHAVRMGTTVGHHEVHYAGPDERVTLMHTAYSRDAFARGALQAAAWVVGKNPGLYSISDVLST